MAKQNETFDALAFDAGLVKEFDIIEDLAPEEKLIIINSQINQIKQSMYIRRIDLAMSQVLKESPDMNLANKGSENERQFRFELEQFARSLHVYTALRDQLDQLAGAE